MSGPADDPASAEVFQLQTAEAMEIGVEAGEHGPVLDG
jgi:hypothetical protein